MSHGFRGARRPFKSLGIDLFPHEWDSVTLSIKSTAKTRLGTVIFQQYVHRIETIKSKFYENMVALENGQKSIDQAFADVLGTNAKDLVMPVLMEHSSNKDEIRYFKDYCKVLGRTPENMGGNSSLRIAWPCMPITFAMKEALKKVPSAHILKRTVNFTESVKNVVWLVNSPPTPKAWKKGSIPLGDASDSTMMIWWIAWRIQKQVTTSLHVPSSYYPFAFAERTEPTGCD